VYVITSAKSKRDKWCVITPFDKKLNNQRNCQKNLHKDESISQNEEWIT
jgi:hypothetical protein